MTFDDFKKNLAMMEQSAIDHYKLCKKKDRDSYKALASAFHALSALADEVEPDQIAVECNVFDICEEYDNCHVQILKNSVTGEISFGWNRQDE